MLGRELCLQVYRLAEAFLHIPALPQGLADGSLTAGESQNCCHPSAPPSLDRRKSPRVPSGDRGPRRVVIPFVACSIRIVGVRTFISGVQVFSVFEDAMTKNAIQYWKQRCGLVP